MGAARLHATEVARGDSRSPPLPPRVSSQSSSCRGWSSPRSLCYAACRSPANALLQLPLLPPVDADLRWKKWSRCEKRKRRRLHRDDAWRKSLGREERCPTRVTSSYPTPPESSEVRNGMAASSKLLLVGAPPCRMLSWSLPDLSSSGPGERMLPAEKALGSGELPVLRPPA